MFINPTLILSLVMINIKPKMESCGQAVIIKACASVPVCSSMCYAAASAMPHLQSEDISSGLCGFKGVFEGSD